MLRFLVALLFVLSQFVVAQSRHDRFALILEEPSLAQLSAETGVDIRRAGGREMKRIQAAQSRLLERLGERGISVTGSTQRLLNAVYVQITPDQASVLDSLPGVARVVRMMPVERQMNQAVELINAPQAWGEIGGEDNAGAGVKIAVLDTGIDHDHPAFDAPGLQVPAGFPKCVGGNCDYTNNKIIVARSYVDMLVLPDEPGISRPDDLSPRDRVGHGTAVAMAAAGVGTAAPSARLSGVAPGAFLGNYKIFGSPGINDVTFDDVIARALEDALVDGMDVAILALGRGADWGPNDRGATCRKTGIEPCDPRAAAVEAAVRAGMTVVVPAGNDGDKSDAGAKYPALNTINTPGTAPSAITVGATTNSHVFFNSVKVTGDVPVDLRSIPALWGDGPQRATPLTAPMRDVGWAEPNARACSPVGNGTLAGAIALIDRGDCAFATKVNHVQKGGAVGAVIINTDSDVVFPMTGLVDTGIPAVMIGMTDGQSLRDFIATNPDRPTTLDPKLAEESAFADDVAYFTSRGPSIRDHLIKPEVVAAGTDLYMATQSYDPNGDMWNPSRYTASQGTSFATAIVGGAAAVALGENPAFGTAEVKSAVVNTAIPKDQLADFDENGAQVPTSVTAAGAGRLNLADVVKTDVTVNPATLSLGVIDGALPARGLLISNHANAPVNLALTVEPEDARLDLSETALNIAPGGTEQITVSVNATPPPGVYEGYIVITGGATALRVPYLYLRGDGVPFNAIPIAGDSFVGNVDELMDHVPDNIIMKVLDRYGVPVQGAPVLFRTTLGGGVINEAMGATDDLGIAAATVTLGPNPGEMEFTGEVENAPGLVARFGGRAKVRGRIAAVVNAASNETGRGVAPGSYVSIYGSNLSETYRVFSTPYLPMSISGVSVSFDVPGRGLSLPGRIHVVSNGQVNVQVPWELQGVNLVQVKVSTGPLTESPLFDVVLNDYSPAFFEIRDPTNRMVVAALDEFGQVVSSANPVKRGRAVQLFANGLGPVSNRPPTGEVTPPSPLAETPDPPEVTIGGWSSNVTFSGLAPYNVGLYQVNVVVPEGLQPGLYELVLRIGGVEAKTVLLYVGE